MSDNTAVGIVIGSTRPRRICPTIAERVRATAQAESPLDFRLIDLAEIALPFLDEPAIPARGGYQREHTKRWSSLVAAHAGFVFVLPQYNWGYPAVLKNALDFLYVEWHEKPAAMVTYGTRGGIKAADQLKSVLQGLHMHAVSTNPALRIRPEMFDADGRFIDVSEALADYTAEVRAMSAEFTELLAPSLTPP